MSIYLLLIVPALIAAISHDSLSKKRLLLVWFVTSLFMVWLMPLGSVDYPNYLRDFGNIKDISFAEAVSWQDPLYTSFVWLFGQLGGSANAFYLLLGSAGLWVKLTALRRLSCGSSAVLLLYFCSYFFLHDFTQLRAGFAIGIWMHALADLPSSRYRYLLLTGAASLIHLQAALGFLLFGALILTRHRAGVWLLVVAALLIMLMAFTQYFDQLGYAVLAAIPDPRTDIYLAMAAQDYWVRPNPYSVIAMLALMTALVGLSLEKAATPQIPGIPVRVVRRAVFVSLLLGSCSLVLLSPITVAAFRVSEHFFSLLPVGIWLVLLRDQGAVRARGLMWALAAVFAYIFLFYSPFLADPGAW